MKGLIYLSSEDHSLALIELQGAMRAMGHLNRIEHISGPLVVLEDEPPIGLAARMGHCRFSGSIEMTSELDLPSIRLALDMLLKDLPRDDTISLSVKAVDPAGKEERGALSSGLDGHLRGLGFRVKYRDAERKLSMIIDDIAYIGWTIEETDRRASRDRRIGNLPFERPVVMEPSLSRTMINMSGLGPGSRIIDPFLGPGALMIEAGLLGLECVGVEIDEEVALGAKKNIDHMGLSDRISAHTGDSRSIISEDWFLEGAPYDGVITDPPFGRSARIGGDSAHGLLIEVFSSLLPFLKDGAPVVLDVIDPSVLDRLDGLEVISSHPVYVHRSMTRYLTLLRKE